jgi:hypothetical protein
LAVASIPAAEFLHVNSRYNTPMDVGHGADLKTNINNTRKGLFL